MKNLDKFENFRKIDEKLCFFWNLFSQGCNLEALGWTLAQYFRRNENRETRNKGKAIKNSKTLKTTRGKLSNQTKGKMIKKIRKSRKNAHKTRPFSPFLQFKK